MGKGKCESKNWEKVEMTSTAKYMEQNKKFKEAHWLFLLIYSLII